MTQPNSGAHQPLSDSARSRAELRKSLLEQRRALAPGLRQAWDAQIARKLQEWCGRHQPASLGVYWPIQAEPDLHACYRQLSDAGIQLALPLVAARNMPLSFLSWRPGDPMQRDEHGIPVPAQGEHLLQPTALLIPCVGFNADNYRLGYGGGYYDRTLALAPRPFTLGIAYSALGAAFPPGEHDVALDLILTED